MKTGKGLTKRKQLEIAMQALADIVHPLDRLRRNRKDGQRLNWMAAQLVRDPDYLQGIAREALRVIEEGDES
jgi:hypothetical protein